MNKKVMFKLNLRQKQQKLVFNLEQTDTNLKIKWMKNHLNK